MISDGGLSVEPFVLGMQDHLRPRIRLSAAAFFSKDVNGPKLAAYPRNSGLGMDQFQMHAHLHIHIHSDISYAF